MKKITILLVLLSVLALPAMAEVTITTECIGSCLYVLSYETDGNNVRQFALDIKVDYGTIDAVSNFSTDYDIYPGSTIIIGGEVNDVGSAVCDDSYPGTLGGLGTDGITIEMASLCAEDQAAPPATGVLCTFTVSDPYADVVITENEIRGGIVMEDPEEEATVTVNVIREVGGCETCVGDIIGNTEVIDLSDLTEMVRILAEAGSPFVVPVTPGVNDCADMVGDDGLITLSDLTEMVELLQNAPGYTRPCDWFPW
ncbi:MAG: hypothetical protein KAS96_01595 [Planctomycetes bacterium]|nr:hypothetical protein [Planctomycetota bacterium]